jgi:hypothetical protein
MRLRPVAALAALLALLAASLVGVSAPAGAVSAPEVVATGLNDPYKLSFDADGDLYVAESGTGGDTCVEMPPPGDAEGEDEEVCFGLTGSVTRIVGGDGAQSRVVTGLPSIGAGEEVIGATDVAVADDGTAYVSIGLGGNINTRAAFGDDGDLLGTVMVSAPDSTSATVFADLAQFEADEDPDAEQPTAEHVDEGGDSNPYGLALVDGTLYAVDAGGNTLLQVADDDVSLVSLFPIGMAPAPPFLGLPEGTEIPYQAVPTSVIEGADGELLISQLTGFPFPEGAASVYSIEGEDEPAVAMTGFTQVVDIALDSAGNLYVAEFSRRSLLAGPPAPRIVQVRPDGTRKTLLNADDLQGVPLGLAVDEDDMLYISLGLAGPENGRVVRVDPNVASDPAIAASCPPALVPGTAFTDIVDIVHREAVECLAWWDVVQGVTATTFEPSRPTSRAHLAALMVRMLREAGVDLPENPADAFDDDDGHVLEADINIAAELGIVRGFLDGTFRPNAPVTRDQMATYVVLTMEVAGIDVPEDAPNAFSDDEGNVHEANINSAAAAGWVRGRTATEYAPRDPARRDQVATMVARLLSTLVDEEVAELPSA